MNNAKMLRRIRYDAVCLHCAYDIKGTNIHHISAASLIAYEKPKMVTSLNQIQSADPAIDRHFGFRSDSDWTFFSTQIENCDPCLIG